MGCGPFPRGQDQSDSTWQELDFDLSISKRLLSIVTGPSADLPLGRRVLVSLVLYPVPHTSLLYLSPLHHIITLKPPHHPASPIPHPEPPYRHSSSPFPRCVTYRDVTWRSDSWLGSPTEWPPPFPALFKIPANSHRNNSALSNCPAKLSSSFLRLFVGRYALPSCYHCRWVPLNYRYLSR